MKKELIVVISVIVFIFGMAGFSVSHAIEFGPAELEFQPYAKAGTIAWDQNDGVGGHKFVLAGGLNANINYDAFEGIINLERWTVSEGLDDDEGIIPEDGYNLSAEIGYRLNVSEDTAIVPYTSIGFGRWDRDGKLGGWQKLEFFRWSLGVSARYKEGFIKIAGIIPFSPDVDKSSSSGSIKAKPGFYAEAGMNWRSITAGLFYEHLGFEDPDAKMTMSGVLFGYRFR